MLLGESFFSVRDVKRGCELGIGRIELTWQQANRHLYRMTKVDLLFADLSGVIIGVVFLLLARFTAQDTAENQETDGDQDSKRNANHGQHMVANTCEVEEDR